MNRRLRIGVAVNYLPTAAEPYRGAANYQRIKALAELADVRAFCLEPRYPRFELARSLAVSSRDSADLHEIAEVEMEHLQYGAIPFFTRALNGRRCARVLLPRLREFRPDVLIAYFAYPMGFAAVAAGSELGVPAIVGAVGSDLRRMNGILMKPIIARTIRTADFVTTVSEELRQRAIARGALPERCRTIYAGCDSDVFHIGDREGVRGELKIDANAQLVLFVGSLLIQKGVRELIEAAAMLIPRRPNLRVVCIGQGPLEAEFRNRASKPDVKDHVAFVGGASPRQIASWLAAANVFCLPSYSEGAPDVVIEAISCGRPVVATNVGGIPELVNSKCGILISPKDSGRLAGALSEALDRAWDEKEIAGCFGRSWQDQASETYDLCRAAVHDTVRREHGTLLSEH